MRRRVDVGGVDCHARIQIRAAVDCSDRDRIERQIQRVGEAGHTPEIMVDFDARGDDDERRRRARRCDDRHRKLIDGAQQQFA